MRLSKKLKMLNGMAVHVYKPRIGSAISLATKKLGYLQLKPHQKVVVEAFLKGRDKFASLPTGSGKSLC